MFLIRSFSFVIALTSLPAFATTPPEVISSYTKMCLDSANMPKPYGESDIKGNSLLGKYCDCLAIPYAERAMKAAAEMQKAGKTKKSFETIEAETLSMRNTCRKQVGLPVVKKK